MKRIDFIAMFTALAAFFYGSSIAYYDGFLTVFHIDYSILGLNFYDMLYAGFLKSEKTLLYGVLYVLFSIFLYVLIQEIVERFFKKRSVEVKNKYHKYDFYFSTLILSLVLIILANLSWVFSQDEGRKQAQNIKRKIEKNEEVVSCPYGILEQPNKEKLGVYRLICGENNCAGVYKIDKSNELISFTFPTSAKLTYTFKPVHKGD